MTAARQFHGELALVTGVGAWLRSSSASFVTGHTLPVDGGFLVP